MQLLLNKKLINIYLFSDIEKHITAFSTNAFPYKLSTNDIQKATA